MPARSPEAEALSKDLKARGGNFVGPTIVYAFMQAVGMVNDHLGACHRHAACADTRPAARRGEGGARVAAHAVGAPARPDRPLAARHRDRRHRARPRPRRALERADARARRSSPSRSIRCWSRRSSPRSTPRAPRAATARGAAARRAGICDRRHDLAVQGGDRRRLQGDRASAAGGDLHALRAEAGRWRRNSPRRSRPPTATRRIYEATQLAGFSLAEARKFFAVPRVALERFCRVSRALAPGGRRRRGFSPASPNSTA